MHPILVFDLDGTLVDTAPDLIDSVNHAIGTRDLPPVDEQFLRPHAGRGGRVMIELAAARSGRRFADPDLDDLNDLFLAHYGDNLPGRSACFPGALAALERFAAAGYALAICTNKPQALTDRLMAGLGADRYFAAIAGADAFPWRKPDPRHLLGVIDRAGGDPARAIMIGDSDVDMNTALAAGIPAIAVSFGYSDTPASSLEANALIHHFDELDDALVGRLIAG